MAGYAVVVEGAEGSYSAYLPDLPGCVAAAETRDELHALIRQAIGMHVESLRHHGEPVPEPAAVDVEVVQPA